MRLVQSRDGREKVARKYKPILPKGNKVFFKDREKSVKFYSYFELTKLLRSSFQLLPRYC